MSELVTVDLLVVCFSLVNIAIVSKFLNNVNIDLLILGSEGQQATYQTISNEGIQAIVHL